MITIILSAQAGNIYPDIYIYIYIIQIITLLLLSLYLKRTNNDLDTNYNNKTILLVNNRATIYSECSSRYKMISHSIQVISLYKYRITDTVVQY